MYEQLPILRKFNYEIDSISFDPLIDSSDMHPEHWVKLAHIIKEKYLDYDGFVVLHGSDTMSHTASALSFILGNLNKPVIITGSQLPLGVLRTDGRENLISAIEIAASKEDDTPVVPEVAIYFENKLYRGNRTYKYHSENFNAFISGNYPVLAESGVTLKFYPEHILKPKFKKLKLHDKLDSNVAIIKLFPGITQNVVDAILNAKGLRAVVLETFGSGNVPTSKWFLDIIEKLIKKGVYIYNISQSVGGRVIQGRYQTSTSLAKMGVIGGADITPEAAITKMMFLIANEKSSKRLKKRLAVPICGEMSL